MWEVRTSIESQVFTKNAKPTLSPAIVIGYAAMVDSGARGDPALIPAIGKDSDRDKA